MLYHAIRFKHGLCCITGYAPCLSNDANNRTSNLANNVQKNIPDDTIIKVVLQHPVLPRESM